MQHNAVDPSGGIGMWCTQLCSRTTPWKQCAPGTRVQVDLLATGSHRAGLTTTLNPGSGSMKTPIERTSLRTHHKLPTYTD